MNKRPGDASILVTGGSGFIGRHLLDLVGPPGDVIAAGRSLPRSWPSSAFVPVDFEDRGSLDALIEHVGPRVVYHLAGRTPPADAPRFYRANTLATVQLLSALAGAGRPTRVVLCGSAAELGPTAVVPVAEEHACRPADAYGLSKWFAARAGLTAARPLEVVVARLFNPIGPGAPASQAFGRFARILADRSADKVDLSAANLGARRDFLDVRDAARALIALAADGRPGSIYHVGSGQSRAVGDGLDRLVQLAGRPIAIRELPPSGRRGPLDSRADIRKITAETSWRPTIAFEQSLDDLWRETIAHMPPPNPHFALCPRASPQ